ncbi:hypothetical protein MD484_g4674, partial [Candolleomyces efflorescens]
MGKGLFVAAAACVFFSTGVRSQSSAPAYGQCGGQGWSGPTTCVSGYTCSVTNQWYSQCIPGANTPVPTSSAPTPTTPIPTPTTTPNPTVSVPSAPSGTPTLVNGYSFVRAVTDPNFHKYLRSETWGTPGDAILGDYMTSALFRVVNGQLIQGVEGQQTLLYAVVEPKTDSAAKKLKVSWSATPATSGSFRWSGDTLEWSDPAISRPQNNAWLVCPDAQGNRDVYINLGPYSYQTPAGCNDHTIHAYTGPVAVP